MKAKNILYTGLGFLTGLVFGISVIGFYSFSNGPAHPSPGGDPSAISAETARLLVKNYLADAAPATGVIKGFTVDRSLLASMNTLAGENTALAGFRVYFGKNADGKTAVLVGVDNLGKDLVRNTIFSTNAKQTGICPPICDVASPLILDK
jgi:hypothetical protein